MDFMHFFEENGACLGKTCKHTRVFWVVANWPKTTEYFWYARTPKTQVYIDYVHQVFCFFYALMLTKAAFTWSQM